MRIFVTGASGFVGSAIVQELFAHGHQVSGLARSDASAQTLAALGVTVVRGDLADPAGLREAAAQADGVIHTAFNHDFSQFQASCEQDRRVILALGEALAGSPRPLLITSAIGVLPATEDATEALRPTASSIPRLASEDAAHELSTRGVNVSIVRLPPSVHGDGDHHGFVPILISLARQHGVSAYPGATVNAWSAVHRLDAARAYRLIIEAAQPDSIWHVVAENAIPFRTLAEAIGRGLGVPVKGLEGDAASAYFGWFAHFAARQMAASSTLTRERLGWEPTHRGLLEDLAAAGYFA